MNERGRIRFGNTTIDYKVRRSERRKKTVQITTDGGGVQITAPMTTPDSELRAIVRKRASWILSHASCGDAGSRAEALRQWRDPAIPGAQRPHDRRYRGHTFA